jgi:UbiD family decarboxylase
MGQPCASTRYGQGHLDPRTILRVCAPLPEVSGRCGARGCRTVAGGDRRQRHQSFHLMPLFRINRGDGGFFLDKACVISRDPDDWDNDNVENVGVYRLQVKGRRKLSIQPIPQHDIAIHLTHAEERGEDLPVAITVSNEPIILLVGAMPILYDQWEYKMAAAMQGEPYKVVRTATAIVLMT